MDQKILYRLDDDILFRKCDLFSAPSLSHGDCTSFHTTEQKWTTYYACNQEGLHFHCAKHPEIELEDLSSYGDSDFLTCPRCKNKISIGSKYDLTRKCLRTLNREIFKDAKLVRLDDWYFHEVTDRTKPAPNYHLTTNIKTDKDGDTIVVLYVSYTGIEGKVQYFIKPEKGQLTYDHHDLDPEKIISKVEVTLKNRKLIHDYAQSDE